MGAYLPYLSPLSYPDPLPRPFFRSEARVHNPQIDHPSVSPELLRVEGAVSRPEVQVFRGEWTVLRRVLEAICLQFLDDDQVISENSSDPETWRHDILDTDGTPCRREEVDFIRETAMDKSLA